MNKNKMIIIISILLIAIIFLLAYLITDDSIHLFELLCVGDVIVYTYYGENPYDEVYETVTDVRINSNKEYYFKSYRSDKFGNKSKNQNVSRHIDKNGTKFDKRYWRRANHIKLDTKMEKDTFDKDFDMTFKIEVEEI